MQVRENEWRIRGTVLLLWKLAHFVRQAHSTNTVIRWLARFAQHFHDVKHAPYVISGEYLVGAVHVVTTTE